MKFLKIHSLTEPESYSNENEYNNDNLKHPVLITQKQVPSKSIFAFWLVVSASMSRLHQIIYYSGNGTRFYNVDLSESSP